MPETTQIRRHGWRPDHPDHRDYAYQVPTLTHLPASVDLASKMPPVVDQGALGSCTGNGIAGLFSYVHGVQFPKAARFDPSRLFIYFNERVMEGTVAQDAGAAIRDGMKSIAQQGVCSETTWPYVIAKFKTKPTKAAYTEALKHQAITYARVTPTLANLKQALAAGHAVVFGFSVYESFESALVAKTGVAPMPGKGERLLGGHCVVLVGYDDAKQAWKCRNSWGVGWGQKGYFTLPYAYLTGGLASDFWTLSIVES